MLEQATAPETILCGCGAEIPRFYKRCWDCRDREVIEKATVVPYDEPFVIVGSDDFYSDLDSALDADQGGRWAHPCDKEPLAVNPKREANDLVERAVESMCEEAFEDAYTHVNGQDSLRAAFEVALVAFNEAQTASSWLPRTKEVFQLPAQTPSGDL